MPATLLALSYLELYAMLLMVVPILLAFFLFVTWAVVVAVRWQMWRYGRWQEKRRARAIKYRPDGLPYPPFGRGMCDRCQRAYDKVYFLEDHRRLCPDATGWSKWALTHRRRPRRIVRRLIERT